MGLKYLWDTNSVIYYLQKNFADAKQELMSDIINKHQPAISAISQIEILCWKTASIDDLTVLNNFITDSVVFELENDVKFKTIELRKSYNIKLADSIIAAIVMDLILITNDSRGFQKISSLRLLNPVTGDEV